MAGGVKAGVQDTSKGAELTLESSATGSSQAFSVSGTGKLATFDFSSGSPPSANAPVQLAQTASNAKITVNGVPASGSSNKFSSALTALKGVTLTVTGKGSSTLTVSSSNGNISSAVSKVATNLNSAVSAIAKETFFAARRSASASASAL